MIIDNQFIESPHHLTTQKSFLSKKILSTMKFDDLGRQIEAEYGSTLWSTKADHLQLQLLYKVLCLPEFMVKFRRRLDYDRQQYNKQLEQHTKFNSIEFGRA